MSQVIPSTIKLGSRGPDVAKWQGIIVVNADGDFGPATETATKTWQAAHKLVADGVVGPATWSVALGIKTAGGVPGGVMTPTSSAPTDQKAYSVAKSAGVHTPNEQQYILAVARGEGFYGNGWGNPSAATIAASQAHGFTGYEGVGSNNWGSIQGQGDAGSFPHIDTHADGSQYVGYYKKYSTPAAGYLDMGKVLLGGGTKGVSGADAIKAAIAKGNLHDAVYQQHANGYFELAPDKYLDAVLKNYQTLTVNVPDWPILLAENGISVAKKWLKWMAGLSLGALAIVGGAYAMSSKKG